MMWYFASSRAGDSERRRTRMDSRETSNKRFKRWGQSLWSYWAGSMLILLIVSTIKDNKNNRLNLPLALGSEDVLAIIHGLNLPQPLEVSAKCLLGRDVDGVAGVARGIHEVSRRLIKELEDLGDGACGRLRKLVLVGLRV
jgi:hypothetical protein